jgi:uncharacterized protein YcgI (DUF1989 family)
VPPRDANAFEAPAGHLFRIVSVEGPQVGDLNLWNSHDLTERFYSGQTRALHATIFCSFAAHDPRGAGQIFSRRRPETRSAY